MLQVLDGTMREIPLGARKLRNGGRWRVPCRHVSEVNPTTGNVTEECHYLTRLAGTNHHSGYGRVWRRDVGGELVRLHLQRPILVSCLKGKRWLDGT